MLKSTQVEAIVEHARERPRGASLVALSASTGLDVSVLKVHVSNVRRGKMPAGWRLIIEREQQP